MDGVTDFACRAMTAKYGRPDVMFTEFTTTVGMFHAPEKVLRDFEYGEAERPIVAQIFGNHPDDFYRAVHVACELGFDGIDVNMGCPAKQVTQKNCGAMLITLPDLALEILRAVRQGIRDWANGQTLEDLKIPEPVSAMVARLNLKRTGHERPAPRRVIPYSVKTRLGYDVVVVEKWVETLLLASPAAISLHGRTLKQMYKGSARWDEIAKAVPVVRGSGTLLLGNGDLSSLEEGLQKVRETGIDGILIGRASIGNPWIFGGIFRDRLPTPEEKIEVALEHARTFVQSRGEEHFRVVRKHLVGYLRGFPNAASLRMRALDARNLNELLGVFKKDTKNPLSPLSIP